MGRQEANVEQNLARGIRSLGGNVRKWVSPGHDGVPDRICILPGGEIHFVEVKTSSGVLSVRQKRELDTLKQLGCNVHVVYGTNDVSDLIEKLRLSNAKPQ
jgi:hypothetical protein